jgi:PPOX class probable F420-dependent enzyme
LATLTDRQAKLLLDNNVGALATIREDGTPNVTPVWVDWDGRHILVNTSYGRAKELHLRRDPRCTLLVVNPKDADDWVSVTGRAIEITEDGAEAHIDKLAMKYQGVAKYPFLLPGERRVKVVIRPERVVAFQPGGALLAKAKARLQKRGVRY